MRKTSRRWRSSFSPPFFQTGLGHEDKNLALSLLYVIEREGQCTRRHKKDDADFLFEEKEPRARKDTLRETTR